MLSNESCDSMVVPYEMILGGRPEVLVYQLDEAVFANYRVG